MTITVAFPEREGGSAEEIATAVETCLQAVEDTEAAGVAAVAAIEAQEAASLAAVQAQQATSVAAVQTQQATSVAAVVTQQGTSVSAVQSQQATSVAAVVTQQNTSVAAVSAQGTTSIAAVAAQEATSVAAVDAQETASVAAVIAAEVFHNAPQVIGYPGTIPNGDNTLNTQWRIINDPVQETGTLTKIRYYAAATTQCSYQIVRIVNGSLSAVGSPVNFTPPGTGYQELTVSVSVQKGDFIAVKNGTGTLRYTLGTDTGIKGFGSGHFAATSLSGALPALLAEHVLHFGFDLTVQRQAEHRIDFRNSNRIIYAGDSYTADRWSILGKSWPQKLADFSEWGFENFAISGSSASSYLANEIRGYDLSYGAAGLKDIKGSYILIKDGENTDAATSLSDAFSQWRQYGQAVMSMGAIPIWGEQHVAIYTTGSQAIFSKLAKEFGCPHWPALAYAKRMENNLDRYAGFWNSSHYNIRLNDLPAGAHEMSMEALGRPEQSIRLFRPRDVSAVSTVADLAFDRLFDRARLWREINHGQGGLAEADENKLDEINTVASGSTVLHQSEYIASMMGSVIDFDDYALVELILPSNRPEGVRLYLSDTAVTVYVRDSLYYGSGYPVAASPTANWRPLVIDSEGYASFYGNDVQGKVFLDKVTFLIYKASAWTWQDPHALWYGEAGKPAPTPPDLSWPQGAELLAQPLTYSGGIAAQWTQTGTPAGSTAGIGGKYPSGITGHVLVSSSNKLTQAVTYSSADYDREVEILVWAAYPRALVVSTDPYPGTNEVTQSSFDWEEVIVEVIYGTTAIPLRKHVGLWWREVRFRTTVPASTTGFSVRLSSRSANVGVLKCSVKFVD